MSYGFTALNDSLELLIVDDYIVPWMCGKCTIASYGSWYDGGGGYELRRVSYSVPGSGLRMLAATLPINAGDVWYAGQPETTLAGDVIAFQIRPTGSGASVIDQELYAFAAATSPPASTGYGMQVFRANGSLSFDLGSRPQCIRALASHAPSSLNTALPTLPSKPAFILPPLAAHRYVGNGSTNTSELTVRVGGFKLTASGLSSKFVDESLESIDAYFNGTYIFGSTATQAVPILDAAIYD